MTSSDRSPAQPVTVALVRMRAPDSSARRRIASAYARTGGDATQVAHPVAEVVAVPWDAAGDAPPARARAPRRRPAARDRLPRADPRDRRRRRRTRGVRTSRTVMVEHLARAARRPRRRRRTPGIARSSRAYGAAARRCCAAGIVDGQASRISPAVTRSQKHTMRPYSGSAAMRAPSWYGRGNASPRFGMRTVGGRSSRSHERQRVGGPHGVDEVLGDRHARRQAGRADAAGERRSAAPRRRRRRSRSARSPRADRRTWR